MALNRLTSAEMMNLSATMVDAGHVDYQALMNQPSLAGLVPGMTDAHNMLLSASQGRLQMQLAPLSDAQTKVDHSHDWLARAVRNGINLYIALARARGDHELASKLERLRDAMFPNGLHIVNASYREEAGNAQMLRTLLTPDVEAALGSLSVQGGTLLDVVHEWIAMGEQLGELENQRVALLTGGRGSDMFRARVHWGKMITVFRVVTEALELSDPVVLQLMDRIARAERVADKRSQNDKDEPTDNGEEPSDGGDQAAGDGELPVVGDELGDGVPDDLLADTPVAVAPDTVAPGAPADMSVEVEVEAKPPALGSSAPAAP